MGKSIPQPAPSARGGKSSNRSQTPVSTMRGKPNPVGGKARAEPLGSIAESSAMGDKDGVADSKPQRPVVSSLKPITTGQTAALDYISEHEPMPGVDAGRHRGDDEGSGPAVKQVWRCARWMTEIEGLMETLAEVLCTSEEGVVLEDEAALQHVRCRAGSNGSQLSSARGLVRWHCTWSATQL